MKLLSVAHARSSWIGQTRYLNPHGKYLYPALLPFLLELYNFKKFPQTNDNLDESKGLIFENGEFENEKGELINIKLIIYDYGIVAESGASTQENDAFLKAVISKTQDLFKLPNHEDILKTKRYLSQLYISTDISLDIINPKLKEISNFLSKNVEGYGDVDYQLGGLAFWPDQTKPINPLAFSIERVINEPFSENSYLSTSQLQTDEHIELLEKLEKILS